MVTMPRSPCHKQAVRVPRPAAAAYDRIAGRATVRTGSPDRCPETAMATHSQTLRNRRRKQKLRKTRLREAKREKKAHPVPGTPPVPPSS